MRIAPLFKENITQYLPENPIIVEAGAHIGRDTVRMGLLWPQAKLHAFEPVPDLYQELLKRTTGMQNVSCYNIALSDHIGTEELHVSSGASTAVSSFFEPYEYVKDRPDVLFTPQMVPTTTLEHWAAQNRIDRVDFMWLDMQGAEQKVLEASPKLLSTVQIIVLEASLKERFKGTALLPELIVWIEEKGFKVIQQDEPKHHKVNMLCVRPALLA